MTALDDALDPLLPVAVAAARTIANEAFHASICMAKLDAGWQTIVYSLAAFCAALGMSEPEAAQVTADSIEDDRARGLVVAALGATELLLWILRAAGRELDAASGTMPTHEIKGCIDWVREELDALEQQSKPDIGTSRMH